MKKISTLFLFVWIATVSVSAQETPFYYGSTIAGATNKATRWVIGSGLTISTASNIGGRVYLPLTSTGGSASLTNTLTSTMNVTALGVKADAVKLTNATWVAGSTNISCSLAAWTAADIGKTICLYTDGGNSNRVVTTIYNVLSATNITIAAAAGGSFTGAGSLVYGTDNTATMQGLIDMQWLVGSGDQHWYFPYGNYLFGGQLHARTVAGRATEMAVLTIPTTILLTAMGGQRQIIFEGAGRSVHSEPLGPTAAQWNGTVFYIASVPTNTGVNCFIGFNATANIASEMLVLKGLTIYQPVGTPFTGVYKVAGGCFHMNSCTGGIDYPAGFMNVPQVVPYLPANNPSDVTVNCFVWGSAIGTQTDQKIIDSIALGYPVGWRVGEHDQYTDCEAFWCGVGMQLFVNGGAGAGATGFHFLGNRCDIGTATNINAYVDFRNVKMEDYAECTTPIAGTNTIFGIISTSRPVLPPPNMNQVGIMFLPSTYGGLIFCDGSQIYNTLMQWNGISRFAGGMNVGNNYLVNPGVNFYVTQTNEHASATIATVGTGKYATVELKNLGGDWQLQVTADGTLQFREAKTGFTVPMSFSPTGAQVSINTNFVLMGATLSVTTAGGATNLLLNGTAVGGGGGITNGAASATLGGVILTNVHPQLILPNSDGNGHGISFGVNQFGDGQISVGAPATINLSWGYNTIKLNAASGVRVGTSGAPSGFGFDVEGTTRLVGDVFANANLTVNGSLTATNTTTFNSIAYNGANTTGLVGNATWRTNITTYSYTTNLTPIQVAADFGTVAINDTYFYNSGLDLWTNVANTAWLNPNQLIGPVGGGSGFYHYETDHWVVDSGDSPAGTVTADNLTNIVVSATNVTTYINRLVAAPSGIGFSQQTSTNGGASWWTSDVIFTNGGTIYHTLGWKE